MPWVMIVETVDRTYQLYCASFLEREIWFSDFKTFCQSTEETDNDVSVRRQASDNMHAIYNFNSWNLSRTYQISLTPPAQNKIRIDQENENPETRNDIVKADVDCVRYIRKGMPFYVSQTLR